MKFNWKHWIRDVGDTINRLAGQSVPDRSRDDYDSGLSSGDTRFPELPLPRREVVEDHPIQDDSSDAK